MSKVIIYPHGDGVAVMYPILDCGLTIEQIALKDIPSGVPYKIIEASDLPDNGHFSDVSFIMEDAVAEP